MITHTITTNLKPDGICPVVHMSQYDVIEDGLVVNILNGSSAADLTGCSARIEGTKADKTGFSYSGTISGSTVTFDITDQMTLFAGDMPVEVRITKDTDDIGTLNIIFAIEQAALDGNTDVSHTELPDIIDTARSHEQAAEIAATNAGNSASDSEAYAKGTRNGATVQSDDPAFENNSYYYAQHAALSYTMAAGCASNASRDAETATTKAGQASASATAADGFAEDAEAYAKGTRDGADVGSTDPAYHNNAMYYAGQAGTSAGAAHDWTEGPSGTSSTPSDTNNAAYWARQAQAAADIHLMDDNTTGIGRPDGITATATNGTFSSLGVGILAEVNSGATEYSSTWLKYAGTSTVIVPDARQMYRVTISGEASLFYWTGTAYTQLAGAGGKQLIDLTIAQYNALPTADKNDPDKYYWITDVTGTGGGGGVTDYDDLSNRPQINGHTLTGNSVAAALGLQGALTFDLSPTANSPNPVYSKGVYTAISALQTSFQAGVDAVYNATVSKGSTPASQALADVVQGILDIPTGSTPTGNVDLGTITTNGNKTGYNVSGKATASFTVSVSNSNSGTYTYPSGSNGSTYDMGADNSIRYVNAQNVYTAGKASASQSVGTSGTSEFSASAGDCYAIGFELSDYDADMTIDNATVLKKVISNEGSYTGYLFVVRATGGLLQAKYGDGTYPLSESAFKYIKLTIS